MKRRAKLIFIFVLLAVFIASNNVQAAPSTYNLSLEATTNGDTVSTSFARNDIFYLNIILDNAAAVAGVTFTLTYDSTKLAGPVTDADGLPLNPAGVTSIFPFTYSTTKTHRVNSSESNKIYLAGAEVDLSDGGSKYTGGEITLFTIKFQVKSDATIGDHTFKLEQTQLFSLEAGYGIDNDGNGIFSAGDVKDPVPILVGAIPNTDPNWDGDLSDDFPDLTSDIGALPILNLNILSCHDNDSDGLCNEVETNTKSYKGANDTGTDPNNSDTDSDGLSDGIEVNFLDTDPTQADSDSNGILDGDEDSDWDGFTNTEEIRCGSNPLDPNSKCFRGLPWLMLLLE